MAISTMQLKEESISGQKVWELASKAGSEHNDQLETLIENIKSQEYYLLNIPIAKVLERDVDLKSYVQIEAKQYVEFSKYREIKQPIVIGKVSRGGVEEYKDGVIDGSNRLAQAFANGATEIQAF